MIYKFYNLFKNKVIKTKSINIIIKKILKSYIKACNINKNK